jgi:hypothetical protein
MSCGVWPLAADVSFEHVKVGLTPVSKLKVPPPRFPCLAKMKKIILVSWRGLSKKLELLWAVTCVRSTKLALLVFKTTTT